MHIWNIFFLSFSFQIIFSIRNIMSFENRGIWSTNQNNNIYNIHGKFIVSRLIELSH
jgi:hypothetical protein